jgi:hypothetical protein
LENVSNWLESFLELKMALKGGSIQRYFCSDLRLKSSYFSTIYVYILRMVGRGGGGGGGKGGGGGGEAAGKGGGGGGAHISS